KLYIMDEPTTGLHLEDIRKLASVFDRLVDAGHTLVLIEHNLDVVKLADWVIDLGPEAGAGGGEVIAMGSPEDVAGVSGSHTGEWLRTVLPDWDTPAGIRRARNAASPGAAKLTGRKRAKAS
ncbi:MAG: excinuclease ABC subunit A, partial [Gemmatimonadaceae bacterium]